MFPRHAKIDQKFVQEAAKKRLDGVLGASWERLRGFLYPEAPKSCPESLETSILKDFGEIFCRFGSTFDRFSLHQNTQLPLVHKRSDPHLRRFSV